MSVARMLAHRLEYYWGVEWMKQAFYPSYPWLMEVPGYPHLP